ncbi:GPW/gp25 family protein [Rhodovulum sulfidophilum]|uniref:GPW/gp25 family protein n=1 Tax=Rhodovulum sulfidophilum TaxID=35806 RepID=UPI000A993ECF|nr:GPW/gp25 family protein [Rhodovulum sulfidophilum]
MIGRTVMLQGLDFGLGAGGGASRASGPGAAHTGALALLPEAACIRQDLLLLLLTVPGERVMRPAYGCHLDRLLFQPNDDTLAGLAIHYVRQAVARFEPRIEILRLDAGRPAEAGAGNLLEIVLSYRIRRSRTEDGLVLQVDLDAGGTP